MASDVVCPECLRANDASSAYCIGCGYRLVSKSRDERASPPGSDDDPEQREFRAELASVRRQLAEAVALLQRLQSRVTQLESRSARDASHSQRPPDVEGPGRTEESARSLEPASGGVIPARRPAPSDHVTRDESRSAQPASRIELALDVEAADSVEKLLRSPEPGPSDVPPDSGELPRFVSWMTSEWKRIDWEQTLGRNWFAIIGALAVVLGIGFFLKLAFDNNWIGDTGRVALGVVVGLALLGAGGVRAAAGSPLGAAGNGGWGCNPLPFHIRRFRTLPTHPPRCGVPVVGDSCGCGGRCSRSVMNQ